MENSAQGKFLELSMHSRVESSACLVGDKCMQYFLVKELGK